MWVLEAKLSPLQATGFADRQGTRRLLEVVGGEGTRAKSKRSQLGEVKKWPLPTTSVKVIQPPLQGVKGATDKPNQVTWARCSLDPQANREVSANEEVIYEHKSKQSLSRLDREP